VVGDEPDRRPDMQGRHDHPRVLGCLPELVQCRGLSLLHDDPWSIHNMALGLASGVHFTCELDDYLVDHPRGGDLALACHVTCHESARTWTALQLSPPALGVSWDMPQRVGGTLLHVVHRPERTRHRAAQSAIHE